MPTADASAGGSWPRSVAIQVVLYDNDGRQQRRLAAGIAAAVRDMRSTFPLERVAVRYGDCSRWPCLSEPEQEAIRAELAGVVDDVSFTFFDANLGSGGGSNALAALGDEHVVWILNPDTYPSPTSARLLLAALDSHGVAATEGRQIPIEHPKDYDPQTGETSWVTGCCVMLRREAFDSVAGFDAHFFPLYGDDVDLSWRLRAAGWTLRHVPRAVIVHDKPIGSTGEVRWSAMQARSSHLARLWLYRRYARPDLERAFLESVDDDRDPVAADAIAEFTRRVDAGDVPDALAEAALVADFVDGRYGRMRFLYAG